MKVKRIIFTPLIENGEYVYRAPRQHEWYRERNGLIIYQWLALLTKNEPAYIYTHTEEEIEIPDRVPHWQWAYKYANCDRWATSEFYPDEETMLRGLASGEIEYHRLDFTKIMI